MTYMATVTRLTLAGARKMVQVAVAEAEKAKSEPQMLVNREEWNAKIKELVKLGLGAGVLAPWIAPYDPTATSFSQVRKPPSWLHWFGTDEVGRDVLARIIYGARASLSAGLVSVSIAVGIGVPLGLLAGYAGGWIDSVLSRIVDAMLAIPFLILAITLSAFLGPSLTNAMIAIGITATPVFIRLTRGQTMGAKVEDYVEAARAVGNPHWRIALRHVLPNIVPPLLVQVSLAIAGAIIAEAALSFLGLGQQPPAPSWGSMLNTAQRFISQAPWMAFWPGFAIFCAVLSFNLLGDAVRDALDAAGIPVVKPIGGHAVYLDARALLPRIPPLEYPGQALAVALYREGGIRGCEIGTVMFGRHPDGSETPAAMDLVRLAIPIPGAARPVRGESPEGERCPAAIRQ